MPSHLQLPCVLKCLTTFISFHFIHTRVLSPKIVCLCFPSTTRMCCRLATTHEETNYAGLHVHVNVAPFPAMVA